MEGYNGDMGELRTRIAHERRRRKMKNSTADELRSYWKQQLTIEERRALENLCEPTEHLRQAANLRAIVTWADEHLFERRSVVNDYELKSAALARGRGEDFDLDDVDRAIAERNYFHPLNEPNKLAVPEMAGYEGEIVQAVRRGMNGFYAFCDDYVASPGLSAEQARAAQKILASHDFVTLFRGGAGTGKSHTLTEIEEAIRATRRHVLVLAPQRQQVQDLENAGMRAQTLAHALTAKKFPSCCVVILDEAGQVGVRDMRELMRALQPIQGRLIVSGDTRQHGAVAAGDALRWIEQHVPRKNIAVLHSIRRQDVELARSVVERQFIRGYRAAVKDAAAGRIAESYDRLERLGCIRELPDEPRREAIAGEYLTALERGESPLVVAQTWDEVHAANDAIRSALHLAGRLEDGELLWAYQPVGWTEAEKHDARYYEEGQSVFFLKGYGRYAKGDLCEVAGADEHGVSLVKEGRRSTVSYRYADHFAVVKAVKMEIAPGDRLQLKANGRSVEGERLHNGELVTVARIDPTGALVVNDDRGLSKTLAPSQRLFVHGYAVTSYASQGKTADTVIVADAGNRAATNRQQWYVSISRGRRRVVVLTPNELELRENIQRSGTRELALEESPTPAQTQSEVMAWRMRRQQAQRYAMMQEEFHARQRQEQQIRHHL
jgi:ATP-dependent exoDNAse (exonuclease V) alpha subunit